MCRKALSVIVTLVSALGLSDLGLSCEGHGTLVETQPTKEISETPMALALDQKNVEVISNEIQPSAAPQAIDAGKVNLKQNSEAQAIQEPQAVQTATETTELASQQPTDATKTIKTSENSDLNVIEFVLASNIEAREPKEIVENYSKVNDKAYIFARLSAKKHSQIMFVWTLEGVEKNRFTTQVHAAKHWRTFASTRIRPGNWKVQLMAGNEVLAEREFKVE